jgi:hypothetical protein
LLGNAILEVRIYATKGELLWRIMAGLLEGIVVESPNVAVVMLDSDTMICGVLLEGAFGGDCIREQIVDLRVDEGQAAVVVDEDGSTFVALLVAF